MICMLNRDVISLFSGKNEVAIRAFKDAKSNMRSHIHWYLHTLQLTGIHLALHFISHNHE